MMTSFTKKLALLGLCLGFFMVIIDATAVNVALPTLANSFGSSISGLQWVLDSYTLVFACFLLFAGNLSDRIGAKKVFLAGIIMFVITSISCGVAPSLLWLNISRVLQGFSAALTLPASLALIKSLYEDPKEQAKAIGIWGSIGGIAAASGPLLGAFLTAAFGWPAVFYINLPFGLLAVFFSMKYVTHITPKKPATFDFLGQFLAIISIAALAYALIETGNQRASFNLVITAFIVFAITLYLFLRVEKRRAAPMLPLQFFKSKTLSAALIVGLILNLTLYGTLFILPLYFEKIKNYSVLLTGLAILPLLAPMIVSSYLSGRITSRCGAKLPILSGLLLTGLGFLALLFSITEQNYALLILPLSAMGFGAALTMPAATLAVIQSVPHSNAGIASGLFNSIRQTGSLIGVALFGTLLSISPHFMSGMHIVLILAVGLSTISFITSLILITPSLRINAAQRSLNESVQNK